MKKILRTLVIMLLIIPCSFIFVACGDSEDPDKEPGGGSGGGGGAQTAILNEGYTALKNAVTSYNNHTGYKVETSTNTGIMDFSMVDPVTEEKTPLMGEEEEPLYSKVIYALDTNTNTGYSRELLYSDEERTSLAEEYSSFVVKNGDKYVLYDKYLEVEEDYLDWEASYVGEDYADKAVFNFYEPTVQDSLDFEAIIASSSSLNNLVENLESYMNDYLLSYYLDALNIDVTVELTPKVTKTNNEYKVEFNFSLKSKAITIPFDETTSCEISANLDVNLTLFINNSEFVKSELTMSIVGTGNVIVAEQTIASAVINYLSNTTTTIETTETAFNANKLTTEELTEIDTVIDENDIANKQVYVYVSLVNMQDLQLSSYYADDLYFGDTLTQEMFQEILNMELSSEEIILSQLYTDKECTVPYDLTKTLPSYDLNLYANVTIPTTKVVIIELQVEEDALFSFHIPHVTVVDIADEIFQISDGNGDYFECTSRKVNGVAIEDSQTELDLADYAGQVVLIEYIGNSNYSE